MLTEVKNSDLEKARQLMDAFASRTGLTEDKSKLDRRYLWTDASAVQTFFGLAHTPGNDSYKSLALRLLDAVHEKLGKYSSHDSRQGWISGLPEEAGRQHPTTGGLRIGKRLPEREPDEPLHEQLEWERDGQYFHYITRWMNALLQASQETNDKRYGNWAAELILAGGRFIDKSSGRLRMYWKMSIDLTRPLVTSMGAHDPLEGLICAESAQQVAPQKAPELENLISDFKKLCVGHNWVTSDALGIGGLLLYTPHAAKLYASGANLPLEASPQKLFEDSLLGLNTYTRMHQASRSANHRLAFRECGLSLGLRVVTGMKKQLASLGLEVDKLEAFAPLTDEIEDFWCKTENQQASTWTDHLDINAVSLAASIVAKYYPDAFGVS